MMKLWRDYNLDKVKINWKFKSLEMHVTTGQLQYETKHLLKKLNVRNEIKFKTLKVIVKIEPHPMFKIVKGDIEKWEIT